jgi:hypothetical protein
LNSLQGERRSRLADIPAGLLLELLGAVLAAEVIRRTAVLDPSLGGGWFDRHAAYRIQLAETRLAYRFRHANDSIFP